jgi:lysophospholipase L1-like esterase
LRRRDQTSAESESRLVDQRAAPPARVARIWVLSALLVAAAIALPVLIGEIACRVAGYRSVEQYRPDRELGWLPAPRQSTVTRVGDLPVRIDDDGFRDGSTARAASTRVIRVYALGASTTFGWGVREPDTYHQVLERMLNDSARAAGAGVRYEIVNAGVIGFNLRQVARYMGRITRRYRPDGFLVAYTFNDGWNKFGAARAPSLGRVLSGVRWKNLLRRSALYNWLVVTSARGGDARPAARGPASAALSQTGDGTATADELADFRATLDSMLTLARGAELSLAFMVLAARDQGPPWPRQVEMARVAAAAAVPVLDLIPVFDTTRGDSLYLPDDAVHPSPLGHELIARLLYGELCRAAGTARPGAPDAIYRAGCGAGRGA